MLKPVEIKIVSGMSKPNFIKPQAVVYTRDGRSHVWEMIKTHDSVHVLVYNETIGALVYVKQVRIPVLVNNPDSNGEVIECCAGVVDKYADLAHFPSARALLIAQDEIREELGYEIDEDDIHHVKDCKTSVGTSGATSHTYIAIVSEKNNIGQDLGKDEDIDIVQVQESKALEYLQSSTTDAVTLMLTYHWLLNKDAICQS